VPRRNIVKPGILSVMHRLSLAFAAVLFLASPALALDAGDRTFQDGRVGAIVKGTSPQDLAKIYGADNVKVGKVPAAEGLEEPGAFIYKDTPNELHAFFSEDGKKIESVRIVGAAWASKDGLRIGTTLAELEKLNGGAFNFSGFGWDYGGSVTAKGAKLKNYGITIAPDDKSPSKDQQKVMGDKQFSSRNPALKNLGVRVTSIIVGLAK
jgi:hypothetical protein